MIIGAFLILTWLVLLLRYPAKALPISLAAVCGLGLVALFVAWQETREASQLARLDLRLAYAPKQCPADRALQVHMKNGNKAPLTELRWRVAAYAPGDTVNLAESTYNAPRYRGPGDLQPGAEWKDCLPLPPCAPVTGHRPWSFAPSTCKVHSPINRRLLPCPPS